MKIFQAIRSLNWWILGIVVCLCGVSLINLASTSLHSVRAAHLEQFNIFALGGALMLGTALIDYRTLQRWTVPLYVGVIVSLVLVLFIGKEINGSRRWLSIAGLGFQPSEIAKLAVIMAVASWFQRVPRPSGYTFRDLIPLGAMVGIPMFLILQEPDLGHTLMIGFIGFTMAGFERFERRTLIVREPNLSPLLRPVVQTRPCTRIRRPARSKVGELT